MALLEHELDISHIALLAKSKGSPEHRAVPVSCSCRRAMASTLENISASDITSSMTLLQWKSIADRGTSPRLSSVCATLSRNAVSFEHSVASAALSSSYAPLMKRSHCETDSALLLGSGAPSLA